MYKVMKEPGTSSMVKIMNTDSKSIITLGGISIPMLNILKDHGYSHEEGNLELQDKWDISVEKEVAEQLARLSIPVSKPIKTKVDKEEEPKPKKSNREIDAMDVLLGLAHYN